MNTSINVINSLMLFQKNHERDIAIIALILGTGIRVSECVSVNVRNINLKDEILDVIRKGGQKDSVPIADWTISLSKKYQEIVLIATMQIQMI